ncbi:hypothetical protein [Actinoplanes sp. NPDC049316]|uniref:hypothetical protein n=1 Tax=Actinoplanes sp. NPDC049316 TaxID=3154727 RepID=UPI00342B70E7
MALTGIALIFLAVLATLAALAATVVTWNRGRRLRPVLRPAGVLATEALLLVTAGLVVNRSEQFYPSWESLSQSADGQPGTVAPDRPGDLDRWLLARAGTRPQQSVAIPWEPGGWTGWHLGAAPTVVVPDGYLQHPSWRYPALVVVTDGTEGWTPAVQSAAARAAGAAVVVFVRTTPATTPDVLAAALPGALVRDVRVTGRRWVLVASTADAVVAERAVAAAPGRYPAAVLVQAGAAPGRPGAPRRQPVGPAGSAGSAGVLPAVLTHLPAGIAVTVARNPAAALVWASRQTPPPLAAAAPTVAYVPVHRHKRHPHRPSATIPAGGVHVPRQLHH